MNKKEISIINKKNKLLTRKEDIIGNREDSVESKEKQNLHTERELKKMVRTIKYRHTRVKTHIDSEERRLHELRKAQYMAKKRSF